MSKITTFGSILIKEVLFFSIFSNILYSSFAIEKLGLISIELKKRQTNPLCVCELLVYCKAGNVAWNWEELIESDPEVGPCRNHRVNRVTRRLEINLVKVVRHLLKRNSLPIHFLRPENVHSIWHRSLCGRLCPGVTLVGKLSTWRTPHRGYKSYFSSLHFFLPITLYCWLHFFFHLIFYIIPTLLCTIHFAFVA